MKHNFIENINSVYFIGIGGISMSALAKYMLALKKRVGGTDIQSSAVTAELKAKGAFIDSGDDNLSSYDMVVYTDAIQKDNAQLKLARGLNKYILPRGKFLREVCKNFNGVTAICGCHGKTTCTAMLANIYYFNNGKFMAHIGGMDVNLGNFYYNGTQRLITEACEYKKNFLSLKPDIAVILNSDFDHADCYKNEKELKEYYKKFALRAQNAICLYGDIAIPKTITFGFDKKADVFADKVICYSNGTTFDLHILGKSIKGITLKAFGRHNILNACAASTAAVYDGITFDAIKEGLENFNGVERRMENIGCFGIVPCIADYAHHPNEIKATVKTIKQLVRGNIYVIFQPHTYSRTKNLFEQFVGILSKMPLLLIYKTYAAREFYDDEGSALTLSNAVKNSCYGESAEDIKCFISKAKEDDLILFLGAGDIYYIAKSILSEKITAAE